jgi:Zn-dependent peptidase ImmA (M78 family)/transcriptional regulator with XRE-family HTH domain
MSGLLFEIPSVPINGQRVRQARELRVLTQAALGDILGIDQTMVAHIERGTKQPNSELLQAIATVLRFPPKFFRQSSPPEFAQGTLLFRAKAGLGKRFISQAHAHAQIVFELGWRLSGSVTIIPVRLPVCDDPIDAARQVRSLMRAGDVPIAELLRSIERLGVWIVPLPNSNECDAFAVWAGSEAPVPVIGIVTNRPGDRTRMNLAHELGHLVLHREFVASSRMLEDQAYTFAAELLMPSTAIIDDLRQEKLSLFRLAQLKTKWLVSMQALARRARELQVITERQYRYLMQQISVRGWRTAEPQFTYIALEKPRAIKKMLEAAFGLEAKPESIAEELNLSKEFLIDVLSEFAGAPNCQVEKETPSVKPSLISMTRK